MSVDLTIPQVAKLGRAGTDFLGVRYPLISGGMTWISDSSLVKAVHDCGGFGVLAAGNMPPELLEQEIDRCNELGGPYAVNLITIAPNYAAHRKIVVEKDVPYVIFAGNFPKRQAVEEVKAAGSKTMSFASTISIAEQQIRFGVDALLLEGSEAGGHIGHVSLTILLQQVLFHNPSVPVFVAGGIATGKMIAHLLLMGAAGCQMGTRFVMSEECLAHPDFKERFVSARAREAVSTPAYDRVRLPVVAVRALQNQGMQEFGTLQMDLLKQLDSGDMKREEAQMKVEEYWMGALRNAVIDGDIDGGSLMAGQSVGLMDRIQPMAEIFEDLLSEAEGELTRVRELL
ncbi:MAG: nitronate monooxygenase [Kiritimatiellia bacterium]|jgi:enoyl-[acyl-carrier protein] reductase II|nr:nitronate monooxygenase [Kiritimatiellia bacterium]MDP6630243.1 nitronate monooxygenase [Kiritimatiellia bacterium]MDP6811512.1 nitronate monooxygenase [Kiritimatiellia bacterium]MDP7023772.1 nitronate monooxygenase [Kiritimatiellia bacterium]